MVGGDLLAIGLARVMHQLDGAVAAITTKAKLTGLIRDKGEVGGVGEFDRITSTEELIAKAIETFETNLLGLLELLDELRAAVIERLGEQATKLIEPPPAGSST
jgi:hypothetical protein